MSIPKRTFMTVLMGTVMANIFLSDAFAGEKPACIDPTNYDQHDIVRGDTLWGISRKNDCSVDDLRRINCFEEGRTLIRTGEKLYIPKKHSAPSSEVEIATEVPEEENIDQDQDQTEIDEGYKGTFSQADDAMVSSERDDNPLDWYAGATHYWKDSDRKNNNGDYKWTLLRYRPIPIEAPEGMGIRVGGYGGFNKGDGKSNKRYTYSSEGYDLGASAKVYIPHGDFDIDLAWDHLKSRGYWDGKEVKNQTDDSLKMAAYGSFYKRRDMGERFLPEWGVGLEARVPLHTEVQKGKETDNTSAELNLTQYLYDIGSYDSLMITPGVRAGIGYQASSDDDTYFKLGAVAKISSHYKTIGNLSYAYKFQDPGQWLAGFSISPTGIWNALQASQIRPATEADLNPKHKQDDHQGLAHYKPSEGR